MQSSLHFRLDDCPLPHHTACADQQVPSQVIDESAHPKSYKLHLKIPLSPRRINGTQGDRTQDPERKPSVQCRDNALERLRRSRAHPHPQMRKGPKIEGTTLYPKVEESAATLRPMSLTAVARGSTSLERWTVFASMLESDDDVFDRHRNEHRQARPGPTSLTRPSAPSRSSEAARSAQA